MARGWLLALILVLGSTTNRAAEIDELMRDAGDTMLRMLPSLYDAGDTGDGDTSDRTLLLENLVRLDYLFKQSARHFEEEDTVGSRVTYDIMRKQLAEAIQLGERRNLSLMRRAVADAFSLCAACHTQDRRIKRAFGVSKIRELDEYLAAEFSWLTRDYASALTSFENYFGGDARTAARDERALERVLVITAEVFADLPAAIDKLREFSKFIDADSRNRERIDAWIEVLSRLASQEDGLQSPLHKMTVDQLDRFLSHEWPALQAALGWHQQEAYWIVTRGELNRFLNRRPAERDVPKLLYWLAVSDRALHYGFYNSLSRGFLERCIEEYPEHPYAKRCLDEYELLVLISFSGSGGTHVPWEVRRRVEELRRLVY